MVSGLQHIATLYQGDSTAASLNALLNPEQSPQAVGTFDGAVLTIPANTQQNQTSQELLTELKALRKEVETLRADNKQIAEALWTAEYDANDKAADKIINGVQHASDKQIWATKSQPVKA